MEDFIKQLSLKIGNIWRKAEGFKDETGYHVILPGENIDEEQAVSGHFASFNPDGKLIGVRALDWGSGDGFRFTNWPTKQDSIYNANAAKQYAPQVFKQLKKDGGSLNYLNYINNGRK